MKNAISLLLAASFLTVVPLSSGRAQPDALELRAPQVRTEGSFEQNRLVTVAIRVYVDEDGKSKLQGLGTGVFLGTKGLALTNQHVAEFEKAQTKSGYRVEVCLVSNGLARPCQDAKVLAVSVKDDLALLSTALPDQEPLVFRPDAEPMQEAEQAYGRQSFSTLLVPSLVYGRFVGYYPAWNGDLYDMAVMPGSSGSPVFDLKNRLAGILRARTQVPGTPFSVVIPIKTVRKFLLDHGHKF